MNAFESTSGSSLSFASAEWNPAVIPLPAVVTLDLADSLFHTHKGVLGRNSLTTMQVVVFVTG